MVIPARAAKIESGDAVDEGAGSDLGCNAGRLIAK